MCIILLGIYAHREYNSRRQMLDENINFNGVHGLASESYE